MTSDSSTPTVLLVEDDQALRELYAMACIKAGFSIIMAENGEQGSRLAIERQPDIVLLDVDMPYMNGHEAAARIREDTWGKTAKIIFLTNHSDPQTIAHAALQKPEEYIIKADTPIHEMMDRLHQLVAHR